MLHKINSRIEMLRTEAELFGLIVNISDSVNTAIAVLDLILVDKTKGFLFSDSCNNKEILCLREDNVVSYAADIVIHLTLQEIETIRNMLLNVFNVEGFAGYHVDLEVNFSNKALDLSIVMQDKVFYNV